MKFVIQLISTLSVFLFFQLQIHAQGNLLLVGGGGESAGGWSDTPYSWMVNQAENKKIGIISYSDADNWLPDYFKDLGAVEAVNIKIDSKELANQGNMFDSLNQYDALFFKGGDQSRYYDYYKNTAVQQAIESIYNRNGVIGGTSAGMAILSGVIFTASEGSAYPYDALSDINSRYMKLADDFLQFYPDYIFDTHFIERGRTARLIGFQANWWSNKGELVNGIGVDDRTAFCINSSGDGTAYGTGAASIYIPKNFTIENDQILDSEVKSIQITHGQTYNLASKEVMDRNLSNTSTPNAEYPFYQVFATAAKSLAQNTELLNTAIEHERLGGKAILISNDNESSASGYLAYLEENLSSEVIWLELNQENNDASKVALRNQIRESSLLVFLDPNDLLDFLNSGPTGELLKSHMKRNEITNVFLGEIANQIGLSYANNVYSDPFNAYYDDLEFGEGLAVLQDVHLITNVYGLDNKDYYENITSAVVDRVLNENLSWGAYLTENDYLSYVLTENNSANLNIRGNLSAVLINNQGTNFEQTEERVSGNSSRLQYAFDSLQYLLVKDVSIDLGVISEPNQAAYEFEEEEILSNDVFKINQVKVLQNPFFNELMISYEGKKDLSVKIIDLNGIEVYQAQLNQAGHTKYNVGFLEQGAYFLVVIDVSANKKYVKKILKSN